MSDAEIGQRVDDGIDDDAERRGNAAFAAAAKPQRVGRGRDFADAVVKNGKSAARGIASPSLGRNHREGPVYRVVPAQDSRSRHRFRRRAFRRCRYRLRLENSERVGSANRQYPLAVASALDSERKGLM